VILATVGTQLAFDRMIRAVDAWANESGEKVVAQIGPGDFEPTIDFQRFFSANELNEKMAAAEVIVSHAGMGSILTAMTLGKPIAIVPRYAKLGEHRNDHQLATAKRFEGNDFVEVVYDESKLGEAIAALRGRQLGGCISGFAPDATIKAIRDLING
jgi:UDP-N-acetylglucosamine transferase subunit ALG13